MTGTPRKAAVLDQIARASPGFVRRNGYVLMQAGPPGCVWSFSLNPGDCRVEFCETHRGAHPVYDRLHESRADIEWVHGGPLLWEISADNRARIAHPAADVGWETGHLLLTDRLCTDMARLQRSMAPFLATIRAEEA